MNFRKSHQILWTLYDLLKSFKAFWTLLSPLTLCWLGLIKLGIKSNANLLLKAMQKQLSQPILMPRSIFIWTYIQAGVDDMVGITKQKKKKNIENVRKYSIFFEIIKCVQCRHWCRDAHAEIFEWPKTSTVFVFYIRNQQETQY